MKQLRVHAKDTVKVKLSFDDNYVMYTFDLTDNCIVQSRPSSDCRFKGIKLFGYRDDDPHCNLESQFRELFDETKKSWSKASLAKRFETSFEKASDIVDRLLAEGWLKRSNYELTYVKNRDKR